VERGGEMFFNLIRFDLYEIWRVHVPGTNPILRFSLDVVEENDLSTGEGRTCLIDDCNEALSAVLMKDMILGLGVWEMRS
jgi:hypothetical protein